MVTLPMSNNLGWSTVHFVDCNMLADVSVFRLANLLIRIRTLVKVQDRFEYVVLLCPQ